MKIKILQITTSLELENDNSRFTDVSWESFLSMNAFIPMKITDRKVWRDGMRNCNECTKFVL